MNLSLTAEHHETRWKALYRAGGYAVIGMLAIMVAQIAVFIAWPSPDTVEGFFALFQDNWLLGLLSLDLLYLFNNALIIPIYLALYMALKRNHESAMLLGLVIGLVGITAYFASNTTFEMLSLSHQYASATGEAQRISLLGAGQAMIAIYKGTAFDVYYVLNAITLLVFSIVMLRSSLFSRATAIWGLAAGVFMVIPSTAGLIGLIFSLASLVPWAVFAILIARRFFQMGSVE